MASEVLRHNLLILVGLLSHKLGLSTDKLGLSVDKPSLSVLTPTIDRLLGLDLIILVYQLIIPVHH